MSRNVFADLGFSDDKSAEMALRIAVAVQIKRVIDQRELTQEDAKRLFGVPQPTISKITRLRLQGLSLALLLRMLFKAGLRFEIASGGSSQSIRAAVDLQPRSSTAVHKDWRFSTDPVAQVPAIVRPIGEGTGKKTDSWMMEGNRTRN